MLPVQLLQNLSNMLCAFDVAVHNSSQFAAECNVANKLIQQIQPFLHLRCLKFNIKQLQTISTNGFNPTLSTNVASSKGSRNPAIQQILQIQLEHKLNKPNAKPNETEHLK
jgi:predicted extracellular nuclease